MPNIFRVPVDKQHFHETMEVGKPVEDVIKYLNQVDKAKAHRWARNGVIKYWGTSKGKRMNSLYFGKLKEGDEVIYYRNGRYIAFGKVAFTTINPDLAKDTWGVKDNGDTWELIYFFIDVILVDMPSEALNEAFGFEKEKRRLIGFRIVNEKKVNNFLQAYGSLENFFLLNGVIFEDSKRNKPVEKPIRIKILLCDLPKLQQYPKSEIYSLARKLGRKLFEYLGEDMILLLLDSQTLLSIRDCEQMKLLSDDNYKVYPASRAYEGFLEKLIIGRNLRNKPEETAGSVFAVNNERVKSKMKNKHLMLKTQSVWQFCRNDIMHYPQREDKVPAQSKFDQIIDVVVELYINFYGKSEVDDEIKKGFEKYCKI